MTGENLGKRGSAGPFRYPMYKKSKQTNHHVLINCSFSIKVRELLIHRWFGNMELPSSIQRFFISWDQAYQGNLDNKASFKNCWKTLPKVMFWNIWIERNQRVFKDKAQIPEQIAAKTQALMGEIMNMSSFPKNMTKLSPDEVSWMQSFKINDLDTIMVKRYLEVWEIRMDPTLFEISMKERKIFKILFDEASKGNLGATRGGDVILCLKGNIETEYYWNIGNDTNNMAEA